MRRSPWGSPHFWCIVLQGSGWDLILDLHVEHEPFPIAIVWGGGVLNGAVVPDDDIAELPAVPINELVTHGMGFEIGEQRPAFLDAHPLEVLGEVAVHIEGAPTGHGVSAHDRMDGLRTSAALVGDRMEGPPRREHLLESGHQGF